MHACAVKNRVNGTEAGLQVAVRRFAHHLSFFSNAVSNFELAIKKLSRGFSLQ